MKILYDTCSLLDLQDEVFHISSSFYISNISINELENIKSSGHKDEEIKYRARCVLRSLMANEDKYEIVIFKNEYLSRLGEYDLPDTNDSRIIASAYCFFQDNGINGVFHTRDLACKAVAKSIGLNVVSDNISKEKTYTGFKEVIMDDIDLCDFYSNILPNKTDPFGLNLNEYLIIKNEDGVILDKYKLTMDGYEKIPYQKFDSKMFGKIVAKDVYQEIAMDSMNTNQVTLVGGQAGSGKSYLSFGYLFQALERGYIDRIYLICNPVGAKGAAKLGFYPGERNDKILSSQVGGVLASKLGDMEMVYQLIEKGLLVLLPIVDARGIQIPENSAVYILEAQNMSVELLKLALQRVSDDTKVIIDGDHVGAQVDMDTYAGDNNGMKKVIEIFKGTEVYGQCMLQKVYRSRVADIATNM